MAAMRRAKVTEENRKPFFLYIDECHSFITSSFSAMLSEIRKYRVGLFLTHQYLDQLSDDVRGGILGNVGTIITFRLGTTDAKQMAEEFYPLISADDFINLAKFNIYIKLLIDGVTSRGFSATLIP